MWFFSQGYAWIHFYVQYCIRMEITVLYLKISWYQLSIQWSQIFFASKLDLRPSNLQWMPFNFQTQYSYLLIFSSPCFGITWRPSSRSRRFRIEFGIPNEIIRKYSETAWKFGLCHFLGRKKGENLNFVIFYVGKSSESWT